MPEIPSRQNEQNEQNVQSELSSMLVERTQRPDGRYLLYFSWPEERPMGRVPGPADAADGAPPDV